MKTFFRIFAIIAAISAAFSCIGTETPAKIEFIGGEKEYTVSADGGSVTIDFTCDKDWFASIILPVSETETNWYSVSGMHGTAGEGRVEVTLQANPRATERTLSVQITAGTTKSSKIKVTQLSKSSPGGQDPVIDAKIEVLPYDITCKSAYFKGVVACSAPSGYESTKPQIGFMISDKYNKAEDIYQYGTWIWPLSNKTTGDTTNVYRAYVSNLKAGTTYYLFTCAEYENDKAYKTSAVYQFSTSPSASDYNGYAYVDLGLSVKWAKCNVGATDEYATGGYFCWGETSTKDSYYPRDYKFKVGSGPTGWPLFSKYVTTTNCAYQGNIDNKICCETVDDAARANMGGTWRLPHDSELKELIDSCTWVREYEMKGETKHYTAIKITGPSGNHIILPFAGNMADSAVVYFPDQGRYLGAELNISSNGSVRCLGFNTANNTQILFDGDRMGGLTIRAVTE